MGETDLEPNNWVVDPCMPTYWTDYLGDMPFSDFSAPRDSATVTETRRYLTGLGLEAQENVGSDRPVHLRRDMLDSTMMITGPTGDPNTFTVGQSTFATVAYTAFGELVWAADPNGETWTLGNNPPAGFPRYAYDGGWGYESSVEGSDPSAFGSPGGLTLRGPSPDLPPISFQHVGERWYQPGTGRFLQRDPLGIDGGDNVYTYTECNPLIFVDPDGLRTWAQWFVDWTGGARICSGNRLRYHTHCNCDHKRNHYRRGPRDSYREDNHVHRQNVACLPNNANQEAARY